MKSYREKTMELLNITPKEYKKRYDVYLKRVRNYERIVGSKEKRDASRLFYYTQKDIKDGTALSIEKKAILQTTAQTTTAKISEKQYTQYSKSFYAQTENFITRNAKASEIWNDKTLTPKEKTEKIRSMLDRLESQRKIARDSVGKYTEDPFQYSEVQGSGDPTLYEE